MHGTNSGGVFTEEVDKVVTQAASQLLEGQGSFDLKPDFGDF